MKTTDKYFLVAIAIGAAAAGGTYWFWPALPWWSYLVVWLVVCALTWRQMINDKAAENVANRDLSGKP